MAIENAKMLNVRIRSKYDNYENWIKSNLVLEPGEIAIAYTTVDVKVDNGTAKQPALLMKVGNGSDLFKDLPWLSARAADVLSVCKNETELRTFINSVITDSGVATDEALATLSNRVTNTEDAIEALELLMGSKSVKDQVDEAIAALNLSDTYELKGVAAELVSPVSEKANDNADAIAAINNEETGILAQAKDYVDEEDIFVTDITTVNALGGIAAGTDLNGLTTHEVLNKLLFPYVAQVVDTPSRTPNTTVVEKGNTQTITSVTVKVTKKSEPITKIELLNGETSLGVKEGESVAPGGTFTFSGLNVSVPSTNVKLTVKVTDASGNVVSKETAGWTFVYPYYVGTCAEGAEINEALIEGLTKKVESKGTKTITFNTDYQSFVFAYPKAHGALKSVLDPNSFEILPSFTQHEVSVTGLDETAQTYYVYVNEPSTVSNFVVTFKY